MYIPPLDSHRDRDILRCVNSRLANGCSQNVAEAQQKETGLRIYLGNLPYESAEEDLEETFRQYGQVESVTIIRDRDTGRSKGFGFVEMPTSGEAQAAISALNGKDFAGRPATVNEAKPRQERSSGGGSGSGGGYGNRGGGGGSRW